MFISSKSQEFCSFTDAQTQCLILSITVHVFYLKHYFMYVVLGMPRIRSMPKITAVSGQDLVVKCPVGGFPITTITWKKGRKLQLIFLSQSVSKYGYPAFDG